MAKAKKLPSGKYRALVYSHKEGSKRKYESFTSDTPEEAELLAAQFKVSKTDRGSSSLTVGDAIDEYIGSKDAILSPSTVREYKRCRKSELQSIINETVRNIDNQKIQKAINEDAKTKSWKTIRNSYGLLSATLRVFKPDFRLNVTLPAKTKKSVSVPSDCDIQKILDVAKDTAMEIPIMLAAFASLRRSEVCALDKLDEKNNIIFVDKALVLDENKSWVLKGTKSISGTRSIRIPEFLTTLLLKNRKGNGRFTDLNPNMITREFPKLCKKAGIDRFRFHDLRHYNASIMLALGTPNKYAQARGGWSSDEVLSNVYQHLMNDKVNEVDTIINNHFESIMQHKDAT